VKQRRLEEGCCWRDGGDQASVALSNNVLMKAATTSVGDITGRCADKWTVWYLFLLLLLGDYLRWCSCCCRDDGTEMKSAANAINGSALYSLKWLSSAMKLKIKNTRDTATCVFPLVGLDVEVVIAFEAKKLHDGQDSNLRGQRPMDFKSIPLTTPAPS
jgi:hypothetical protein